MHSFNKRNLSFFIDVYNNSFSLITTRMILGTFIQVNLATKIDGKIFPRLRRRTQRRSVSIINDNNKRKLFFFYPLGVMNSFRTRNLSCFIDVYNNCFSLITTMMILGAFMQVNLATKIDGKIFPRLRRRTQRRSIISNNNNNNKRKHLISTHLVCCTVSTKGICPFLSMFIIIVFL